MFVEQIVTPAAGLLALSRPPQPVPRYRIERHMAEGGMGTIFVGKRMGAAGFEKPVVLKQLRGRLANRPEFLRLFLKEARISAQLDHVNIVRTLDLARLDEDLFIVMEYVDGADLKTILRSARLQRTRLSTPAVLYVALEILQGLRYAQQRKTSGGARLDIVHRDISPANILCSRGGEVKLSDFGIVKTSTEHTAFLQVRGKPGYMSPEQLERQNVDVRSDLFSLAVCLHEALTGQRLFVADPITACRELFRNPAPPLGLQRPDLPPALGAVLATALQYDPNHRFQTVAEFITALRHCVRAHRWGCNAHAFSREVRDILNKSDRPSPRLDGAPPSATRTVVATGYEGKEATSATYGLSRDERRPLPPAPIWATPPRVSAMRPASRAMIPVLRTWGPMSDEVVHSRCLSEPASPQRRLRVTLALVTVLLVLTLRQEHVDAWLEACDNQVHEIADALSKWGFAQQARQYVVQLIHRLFS